MKLKTSVAAVILAFSATGAWAGPTGADPAKDDLGTPDAAAVQPSAGAASEELNWQFVNGQAAGADNQATTDQSAHSQDQGDDQSAMGEAKPESDQSAASGQPAEAGQAVSSEEQGGDDQTAKSEEQDGDDQAASSDDDGRSEQSAKTDEEGEGGQAAAEAEDQSDQAANAEEQEGDDKSARSEDGQDSGRSANSDQPAADLKDKVVVIIPKDWKGSIPGLIAALENSPDAKDIVIVQQGEPQASNEPDDSYSASSMRPVINQQ